MKSLYKAIITFGPSCSNAHEFYFVASTKEEIWEIVSKEFQALTHPQSNPEDGFNVKVSEVTPLSKIRGM